MAMTALWLLNIVSFSLDYEYGFLIRDINYNDTMMAMMQSSYVIANIWLCNRN